MGIMVSCRTEPASIGEVKVIRIKGEARYKSDRDTWEPITKGAYFKPGFLIQTAPKTMVDLCLNEGHPKYPRDGTEGTTDNVIRIFENSALKLNKLTKEKSGSKPTEEIKLDLLAGQMMGSVGTLHQDSNYEINLSHGFVRVQSGTYMVSSRGVLNVLEGIAIIVITNREGPITTNKLGKHQSFDPETGTISDIITDGEMNFYPLRCSGAANPTPALSPSGTPHGSGIGGSLRKF
jgi:hypothetical protein